MADSDRIINHEDGQGIKEAIDGITTAVKDSISFNIGNGSGSGSVQTKNSHAIGENSFAEGSSYAYGVASHAEGSFSFANGDYSHAGGENSSARGKHSFAHGNNVHASKDGSFAFGDNIGTTSEGQFVVGSKTSDIDPDARFAIAFNGRNLFNVMDDGRAKVSAAPKEDDDVVRKVDVLKLSSDLNLDNGTGEGSLKTKSPSAVASGDYSLAIGQTAHASGKDSIAMGLSASASGESSVAIGCLASASGSGSAAIGYQASASGTDSVAIGEMVKNPNGNTIAVGNNFTNASDVTFVVGENGKTLLEVSEESTSVHGNLYVDDDVTIKGKLTAEEYTVVKAESVDTERYTIGLAKGNTEAIASYVGLYATNYDGRNTGALVWDNTGTAYVGDASVDDDGKVTDPSGTLQPLMTREKDSALKDKGILAWDKTGKKATNSEKITVDGNVMLFKPDGTNAALSLDGDTGELNLVPSEKINFLKPAKFKDTTLFTSDVVVSSDYTLRYDTSLTPKKYVVDNFAGLKANNEFSGVNTFSEKTLGDYCVEDTDDDKTLANKEYVKRVASLDGLDTRYLRLDGTNAMTGNFVLKNAVTIDAYDATNTTKESIVHVINDNSPRIYFGSGTYKACLSGSDTRPYYLINKGNQTEIALLSDIPSLKKYCHTIFAKMVLGGVYSSSDTIRLCFSFSVMSDYSTALENLSELSKLNVSGKHVCSGWLSTDGTTTIPALYAITYAESLSSGGIYFYNLSGEKSISFNQISSALQTLASYFEDTISYQ